MIRSNYSVLIYVQKGWGVSSKRQDWIGSTLLCTAGVVKRMYFVQMAQNK